MESFFSIIFAPIKQYLIDQGVWEPLVQLHDTVLSLLDTVMKWLGVQTPDGTGAGNIIIEGLKLSLNIFITLIKVLIEIANWIIGLFH